MHAVMSEMESGVVATTRGLMVMMVIWKAIHCLYY